MSRSLTNNFGLSYGIQSAIDVDPTAWVLLEPNAVKDFGAEIKKVARRPISKLRSRRKGAVVDLDSKVSFDADLTGSAFNDFAEGFMFSEYANKEFDLRSGSGLLPPPAVSGGYTIDAASATLAGKAVYAATGAKTLLFAKGFLVAANNGLKPLSADIASTDTTAQVAGNSAETPPTNASVQIAGVRVDAGDLTLTVSGSTATLVSAAYVANWATLGIQVGQYVHVGSGVLSTGAVQNAFTSNTVYGYARVTSIVGGTLNLDKLDSHLASATGGVQDIMFSRFVRNVPVDANSTDNRFLERFFTFEGAFQDLGGVGTPEYQYPKNNLCDQLSLNLPLTDKAVISYGFIGTDTPIPTTSRKTGASAAVLPLRTTAFGTASDIASLSTDLISSVSDVAFKSLTVELKNNVSPEKAIATLGARFMNEGLFEVSIKAQLMFTSPAIVTAIRNNTTVTFATILKNDDGAIALDIPELTFEGGKLDLPLDKTILINITGETFKSATYGYDLGVSLFPFVPTVRS